ncbi:hypothetical protein FM101_03335 [Arthrobacter rhombi]|uniref:Uncharacterized protein n=1 Tax=Arthrobacter rhombi TaxID=71253 RepID=A0A1R4FC60_9MICC|nr:hypothetical protein FM101_03335 [Arthrobacter rhombi]
MFRHGVPQLAGRCKVRPGNPPERYVRPAVNLCQPPGDASVCFSE